MSFSDFLIWLLTPSCPPIAFFGLVFVWYLAGFMSEAFCNKLDHIHKEENKNENNQ